jgi:flagellin-specific chaperone FliS
MSNIIERFDKFTTEIKTNIAEILEIESDNIILLDESISIGGNFEITDNLFNGLNIKTPTSLCFKKLELIKKIHTSWEEINTNFYHYIHIKNQIGDSYIDTPKSIVSVMINHIEKRISDEFEFLLPFRERIKRTYDVLNENCVSEIIEVDKTLTDNLIELFDYVISFSFQGNKNKFTYYINKIDGSGKSFIIKTDEVYNHQTKSFVESLMYYGNIKI